MEQLQDQFKKTRGDWKKERLGRENNTKRNDCTVEHNLKMKCVFGFQRVCQFGCDW